MSAVPDGWEIVTDGNWVDPKEPLLVKWRGEWVPARMNPSGRRNRRSIDVQYPVRDGIPAWQRNAGRFSVDKLAKRVQR